MATSFAKAWAIRRSLLRPFPVLVDEALAPTWQEQLSGCPNGVEMRPDRGLSCPALPAYLLVLFPSGSAGEAPEAAGNTWADGVHLTAASRRKLRKRVLPEPQVGRAGAAQSGGTGQPAVAASSCQLSIRISVSSFLQSPQTEALGAEPNPKRLSAVERLEADKAKYVKSLHVANTRQEPVQPLLSKQPLFSPGTRRTVLTPSRRVLPGPGRRPQLDLDILSSLINLCDSPVSPAEASAAAASSPTRPPGLQRSKSDLSERFSRAAADLERFFNFCGLDPEEARGLGVAHLARASSDIVSLAGPSAGPASSEGGCSRRSSATVEERARERVPYGVSVVERNARVIKWLYGLRQAWESPAAEG
ncbi:hypothetical protein CB1_001812012 [Camelus ferus]|nr:hypothetical protein CB1_001812012 [Camelus ferus]